MNCVYKFRNVNNINFYIVVAVGYKKKNVIFGEWVVVVWFMDALKWGFYCV